MQIGVGLPNSVLDGAGGDLLAWARAAEEAGFASLSMGDRLCWPGTEPLLSLAAVAGATERIRLSCEVLIAAARADVALLASQTATLQHVSGGRFTLGVGAGARRDDFEVSGTAFAGRGARLDGVLQQLRALWAEGTVAPALSTAPPILIGGRTDATLKRMARWGDGTVVVGPPAMFAPRASQAATVWQAAGRAGRPRVVAHSYFALGENAPELAAAHLGGYYAFMGPMAAMFVQSALTSPAAIRDAVSAYAQAGADELVFITCGSGIEQLHLLADAVGELPLTAAWPGVARVLSPTGG